MPTTRLLVIGLATSLLAAVWVRGPGYMDADYYLLTGRQLARGQGFTEPVLWNYLDDPSGLPHPSHLYWQPLTSLLAAGSMVLFGESFRAAQGPFVLIAAALPLLTARIGFELTRDRELATQAGLLTSFSGLFLPFFVTTDAFALYAALGGATFLLIASALVKDGGRAWLWVGILCGLAGLARADNLLLAIAAMAAVRARAERGRRLVTLFAGFLLVIAPWWARTWSVSGSLSNPGSVRLLWMLGYDDLFSFPSELLSFDRWRQSGLLDLMAARGSALIWNFSRLVAENGLVFLGPLMLIGAVRLWSRPLVRMPIYYLGLLFAVMTAVFPFIGPRGAFFHSSTAAMPVLWALAPIGLRTAIDWAGSKRNWDLCQARRVLGSAALWLAAGVTLGLYVVRVVIPARSGQGWGSSLETYAAIDERIPDHAARVAINNPPGFSLATGREAVVIPNGSPEVLHQVVRRYEAQWVVLESNHPSGLDGLYAGSESRPWLVLAATFTDAFGMPAYLFSVTPP